MMLVWISALTLVLGSRAREIGIGEITRAYNENLALFSGAQPIKQDNLDPNDLGRSFLVSSSGSEGTAGVEESVYRFKVFKRNYEHIQEHNDASRYTYEEGVNEFSYQTEEENMAILNTHLSFEA